MFTIIDMKRTCSCCPYVWLIYMSSIDILQYTEYATQGGTRL